MGAVLYTNRLRCRIKSMRRVELCTCRGSIVRVMGYLPLSSSDRLLASLTSDDEISHPPTYPPISSSSSSSGGRRSLLSSSSSSFTHLFSSLPYTRLYTLVQQHTVFFSLSRLSVVVICFTSPHIKLRCVSCPQWCKCAEPKEEPLWSVQCTVDDGTGQANIMADGELALRLLRVDEERRQRVEQEFLRGTQGVGGREALVEWLWAELFRDPSERARRLR